MENTVQKRAQEQAEESKPNLTGIPTQMKRSFESRSGLSFDDVRVHYNSDKPAQLQALAYTQGTQVYVGAGQERHLPHELGHVVQQKAGVVRPTTVIGGMSVNTQSQLESQADRFSSIGFAPSSVVSASDRQAVIQRLPNLGQIAVLRFQGISDAPTVNQALNPPLDQNYFINCGLPLNLVNQFNMQPLQVNAMLNYALVLRAIFEYYNAGEPMDPILAHIPNPWNIVAPNNLQVAFGADRGNLDPRNQNDNDNQCLLLLLLIEVLNHTLLVRVRKSVTAGRNFRNGLDDVPPVAGDITAVPPGIAGTGVTQLNWEQVDWATEYNYQDISEGTARFNALVQPTIPIGVGDGVHGVLLTSALPDVDIGTTAFGGMTAVNNHMDYGLAVGPSQVVHEMGHHLEHKLGVSDLLTVHNFLRARTLNQNAGDQNVGWGFFGLNPLNTYGNGYNAELPSMCFQSAISRALPSFKNLIPFGLYNLGNWMLSGIFRMFGARERGQRFVDDFFLQDSNSRHISYATLNHEDGNTEFISTTAELLSTVRGAEELIQSDPLRAALFVYIANKRLYRGLSHRFTQLQVAEELNAVNLDNLIHVI